MIDAGKAYTAANKQFVSGIRELAHQSTKDEVIEVTTIISFNLEQLPLNSYRRDLKAAKIFLKLNLQLLAVSCSV